MTTTPAKPHNSLRFWPNRLAAGGCIRVVSVAGRVDATRLDRGIDRLRRRGYRVELDRNRLTAGHPYLAAALTERLKELAEALADPQVDALWCARGGFGAMHLLAGLETAELASWRKPFVGFSDITALHLRLNRAGLVTLHAPVLTALGTDDDQAAEAQLDEALDLLSGRASTPQRFSGRGAGGPSSEGPLVGGNLSLLAACLPIAQTALRAGAIVLIEDVSEPLYRLDRMISQLVASGALDGAAGFALGSFRGCGRGQGGSRAATELLIERLAGLARPIVADLKIGHAPGDRPVWLNAWAHLDGTSGCLEVAVSKANAPYEDGHVS